MLNRFHAAAAAIALSACAAYPTQAEPGVANPAIWPSYEYPVPTNPADEARIVELLRRMTLEEKVGQLVQADLCCVTPDDVRQYNLGSVLNGGNSGPHGNDLAPAPEWLALADEFYAASVDTSDGGVGIPVIWGTDAVHGHANIIGATVVEAYPVDPGSPSYRFMGFVDAFAEAGFQEVGTAGLRRHVMRLGLADHS